MGIFLASLSAASSGISVVFSKRGSKAVNPYSMNAITNTVIFLMFAASTFSSGGISQLQLIQEWDNLIISSLALAMAWLFYYLGLKDGPVGGVLAIQNLSIGLTLVLEKCMLHTPATGLKIIGAVIVTLGSFLMVERQGRGKPNKGHRWVVYEGFSAVAMAVSFIYTKMEVSPIDSSAASLIRYVVVVIVMWGLFLLRKVDNVQPKIGKPAMLSILWGGIFLGGGYILMYEAMEIGSVTVVTTIFRMNIVIATILSAVVLKEEVRCREAAGLVAMMVGILLVAIG